MHFLTSLLPIYNLEGPNFGTLFLWQLSPAGAKYFAFAPPVAWTLTKRLFEAFAQM